MTNNANRKRIAVFVFLAALVGLLVMMPVVLKLIEPPIKTPAEEKKIPLIIADSEWKTIAGAAAGPVRGNPKTPFTMVEFGDFQCEPCLGARPKLEAALKQYPKGVNLLFVNRPLPKSHAWAIGAAEFAQTASYYGKFWEAYDFLYDHQKDLEPGYYPDYALKVGLTAAQYGDKDKQRNATDSVAQARDLSNRLGVKTTPTVVVRDNSTGKLTAYVGGDDVDAMLKAAPWIPASAKAATSPEKTPGAPATAPGSPGQAPSSPAAGFPFSAGPGAGAPMPH